MQNICSSAGDVVIEHPFYSGTSGKILPVMSTGHLTAASPSAILYSDDRDGGDADNDREYVALASRSPI